MEKYSIGPVGSQRYGMVAQALHWITAVLVVTAFYFGPGGSEDRVYSPARDFDRQLHETLGLCVFVLAVIRVAWRAVASRPEPAPAPRWMHHAGRLVQAALFLLLFALPATAASGAWLEGHPLTFLAGLTIASPLATSHDTGATIAVIHTWLGDAILWVAGIHALAAIYHHVVMRDGVLVSMLPRWAARRE
jgi:cytochrome b561